MKLRRSVSLSYGDLFEDWEIAVAKKLVNEYRKEWRCLQQQEFDDLLQECLSHWFFARDKFGPDKGASKKTFMGRVVRNKLLDIVEKLETDMRKIDRLTVSLDEPLGDDESDSTLLGMIETTNIKDPEENWRLIDLKIDMSKASRDLSPRQKKLYDLLERGFSMTEAAELLKTRRSTLYDERERIKKMFLEKGLEDYLE